MKQYYPKAPPKQRLAKSFKGWLNQQRARNDAVGDLARDAWLDESFPKSAKTIRPYRRHMEHMHASDAAMDTLEEAWEEWARYSL